MPTDALREQIVLIEQYCKKDNIPIFYGEVDAEGLGEVVGFPEIRLIESRVYVLYLNHQS